MYLPFQYILFLCYSVFSNTLSTRKPFHSSTHLYSSVTLSFITSNSSTRQPVYSSTHITTYILLAIGFFVLYLCIVIRNEGMTNGVLMNQIIYNN